MALGPVQIAHTRTEFFGATNLPGPTITLHRGASMRTLWPNLNNYLGKNITGTITEYIYIRKKTKEFASFFYRYICSTFLILFLWIDFACAQGEYELKRDYLSTRLMRSEL